MVDRIGKDSALVREALRAAQRQAPRAEEALRADLGTLAPLGAPAATPGSAPTEFARALEAGLARVDEESRTAENLPLELLTGKVTDFHEIAVQLKTSELSFKFAMEIRNKLVDAYREIMRMSV